MIHYPSITYTEAAGDREVLSQMYTSKAYRCTTAECRLMVNW